MIVDNAIYLSVKAKVRYWEDATVCGKRDEDGTAIPFRTDDLWCPLIRLSDGQIVDWPTGITAAVHYKVCDEGEYWLCNRAGVRIAKWNGVYVPDRLLYWKNLDSGGSGCGDYIAFEVDERGKIINWTQPQLNAEEWQILLQPAVPTSIFIRKPCPNTQCQSEEIDYDDTRHRWWCRKCSLCGPSNDPSGALWDTLPRAQDEEVVAAMQKAIDALKRDLSTAASCLRHNIDTDTARIIERETFKAEIAGLRSALVVEISAAQALGRECDSLREQLKDIEDAHREVMAEPCPGDDQVHCTCVPALRREVKTMQREMGQMKTSLVAFEQALTPSAETKSAYIGEFTTTIQGHDGTGNSFTRDIAVSWTTIKSIMKMIRSRAVPTVAMNNAAHAAKGGE